MIDNDGKHHLFFPPLSEWDLATLDLLARAEAEDLFVAMSTVKSEQLELFGLIEQHGDPVAEIHEGGSAHYRLTDMGRDVLKFDRVSRSKRDE